MAMSRLRRALLTGFGGLLLLGTAGVGVGCHAFSAPTYRGPTSDHFDGERFHNPEPRQARMTFLQWQLNRERGPWNEWTDARLFAGLGNKAFLESKGLSHVTELDWWQEAQLTPEVKLVSTPSQHFSNRGLDDRNGTLWTSYVLQGPSGVTFFAGDTGYGKQFRQVRERFGPVKLAVLPIGAYKPEAFMEVIHVSPKEAVQASVDLEAKVSVPMDYGTFNLGDDGQEEPVTELRKALDARPDPKPEFWVLGFGEGRDVP